MKSLKNAQKGFTLVEIAIVLVIIGLLLGGVLRGQELIDSGRSRQVVNDMNSISAAYYAYQDRYRRVPGDDNAAHGFLNAPIAPGATGGDGLINGGGTVFTSTAGQERGLFWGHLRNAGFVKGATDSAANAQRNAINAFEQQYGATLATGILVNGTSPIPSTNLICVSVPPKAAQAIDSNLDDGLANTGTVRGTATATPNTEPAATVVAGAAGAPYNNASPFYTMCKSL